MHLNFYCNHKCGSSWFFKYLGDFARLNDLPFISTNRGWKSYTKAELPTKAVILFRNSDYNSLTSECEAGVRIIRHPMSIVTSAYYSHLNSHRLGDWKQLRAQREVLSRVDKDMGMALTVAFLEKSDFYFNSAGPLNALLNWSFDDKRFVTIKMEDFVDKPNELLQKSIVAHGYDPIGFTLPVESKYTFEAMSGRKVGEEDRHSHYRSGSPDDWKSQLPSAVITYLSSHFSDLLHKYYQD